MKNAMIRALMIAMLATSMSIFAVSEETKAANNTSSGGTNSGTATCPADGQGQGQADKNENKSQQQELIEQQDKEWLHNLQYLGG
jgi:hypothetical protein